MIRRKDNILW